MTGYYTPSGAVSADPWARAEAVRWTVEVFKRAARIGISSRVLAEEVGACEAAMYNWRAGRSIPQLRKTVLLGRRALSRLVVFGPDGRIIVPTLELVDGEAYDKTQVYLLVTALREERLRQKLTQAQVAARLRAESPSKVTDYENFHAQPRPATAALWAAGLECRIGWTDL